MIFYNETEIQDTPIGSIPKDWKFLKLGHDEICEDIFYGLTAKATERNTGLKMLRTTDIKNYSAEWDKLPFCEITERRNALDKYFLKRGDIIIARAGTVGVSVLADRDLSDVIFGSYLIKVKLKPLVLPKFIHYFLQSKIYWKHIARAQGSTLKNINLPILKSLYLPVPSLQEQRAIAEILGVVDSAVELVDKVIAKTERLKKGLMQTLLTRGIGHKEYKQTPIGTIPKEWNIARISELGELQYGYTTSAVQEDTGTKFLRITDIQEDGSVNWEQVPYCHVEEDEFSKYALQKGDLLFARIGATAGKTTYINHDVKGIFASYLIRLKTTKENVHPHFLFYFTQSSAYWSQALRQREGQLKKGINATMLSNFIVPLPSFEEQQKIRQREGQLKKGINATMLSNFIVPLPSFEEQQKIAEILCIVDHKLGLERKEKAKFERIKQGLMDLLLTGKIRVKVD